MLEVFFQTEQSRHLAVSYNCILHQEELFGGLKEMLSVPFEHDAQQFRTIHVTPRARLCVFRLVVKIYEIWQRKGEGGTTHFTKGCLFEPARVSSGTMPSSMVSVNYSLTVGRNRGIRKLFSWCCYVYHFLLSFGKSAPLD